MKPCGGWSLEYTSSGASISKPDPSSDSPPISSSERSGILCASNIWASFSIKEGANGIAALYLKGPGKGPLGEKIFRESELKEKASLAMVGENASSGDAGVIWLFLYGSRQAAVVEFFETMN